MSWIIVLALVAGFIAYTISRPKATGKTMARPSARAALPASAPSRADARAQRLADQIAYLKAQWGKADQERASGALVSFPSWFFDPVTEKQLTRIRSDDLVVAPAGLTKGAASDLIGLGMPIEDGDAEVLRFFKVPTSGVCESVGRYEARRLLADPHNAQQWAARPAGALEKEQLRCLEVATPRGLTQVQALELIAATEKALRKSNPQKLDDWMHFTDIIEQFEDRELREDLQIKKPSLADIRAAVESLRADGQTLEQLATDIDVVGARLQAMKPALARAS